MVNALKIVQDSTTIYFYADEVINLPEEPTGDVVISRAQSGKAFVNVLTSNFLEFNISIRHYRGTTLERIRQLRALKGEFTLYPYLVYSSAISVKAIMIPKTITEIRTFGELEANVVTSLFLKESSK